MRPEVTLSRVLFRDPDARLAPALLTLMTVLGLGACSSNDGSAPGASPGQADASPPSLAVVDDGCPRSETLAAALQGVLPASSREPVTRESLASLDALSLRRLYRAAQAPAIGLLAGRSGTVLRTESSASASTGTVSFRPVETTAGDAVVGYLTPAGGARAILRGYRTASYADACDAIRLGFNLTPNDADTRRSKLELRQVAPDLLLGTYLRSSDLDRDGQPLVSLDGRAAFEIVALDGAAPYEEPAGIGFPWVKTPPTTGTCPATWKPAFAVDPREYPFAHRCAALRFGIIHYIDESPPGAARGTVFMVHGNPVWSWVYRLIARDLLAAGFRVVAMDHYGFGLSDKPGLSDYPALTTYGFMPHEQSETVEELVEALDLRDMTLMVQDWGGPTGLGMAAHLPSRVRNLVIMNTWASNSATETPWGVYNRTNSATIVATAETPRRTGENIALLYGAKGTAPYTAVRDGYWGPFIDPATAATLTPTVAAPTNIFALNIFADRDFLGELDRNVRRFLRTRKAAFLYSVEAGAKLDDGVGSDDGLADFLSFWEPSSVVLDLRAPDAAHFIQETHRPEIVAAVEKLNPR